MMWVEGELLGGNERDWRLMEGSLSTATVYFAVWNFCCAVWWRLGRVSPTRNVVSRMWYWVA